VTAAAARPADPDPIQQLGLLWTEPSIQLRDARLDFERGDLEAAALGAVSAEQVWLSATELGRSRLLFGIGVAILVVLAILFLVSFALGRRAARRQGRLVVAAGDPPTAGEPGTG
jgi:hypothetical protein